MFIVLLTKKFVQIMYFVIKTDNTFIIFTFSCSKNIVPWIPIKARGCCMHVFLVSSGNYTHDEILTRNS